MSKVRNEKYALPLAAAIIMTMLAMLRAEAPVPVRADNPATSTVLTTNVVTILVTNVVTVMVTNVITNVVAAAPSPTYAVKPVVAANPAPKTLPKPKPLWDTSGALGLSLTRGNSDTALFTGKIVSERKNDIYELSLGADAAYGENSSVANAESVHGFSQYNQLWTPRAYTYGRFDALHDGIADLQYRITLSPGAGYYLIKGTQTTLSAEAGPGVVIECQNTQSRTYATSRAAEKYEHKVNDHVKIWENAEFLPDIGDMNEFVVNSEIGVESALTKTTSLRVYMDDNYNNIPSAGRVPNDLKVVSALAFKF